MTQPKTHRDFLSRIGNTHLTAAGRADKQWNRYYFGTYSRVVRRMLVGCGRGVALDVGTSHGSWYEFLKAEGFAKLYGVELDRERAEQARRAGYDEVFNCEASDTPLPNESLDVALCNDVFVHILAMDDKIRVLRRVEELLKPGGCLVVNHASAFAHFGVPDYRVVDYCSFMSLDDFVRIVHENTTLRIVDVRSSYFRWRNRKSPLLYRAMRLAMRLPAIPNLLSAIDIYYTSTLLPPDESDVFYLKLRK